MDDILVMGKYLNMVISEEKELLNRYKGKSMGDLKHYLGMVWKRDRKTRTSWLDQSQYARKVVKRFGMENLKYNATPVTKMEIEQDKDDKKFEDVNLYQQVVGSLIYLSIGTRPEIGYAISVLSRRMTTPPEKMWKIAKSVLRYLNGTLDYGIQFGGNNNLVGYSDADWGADKETRRSRTGYLFKFGGPISWKSCLQKMVATSTMNAEYLALHPAVQEGVWLQMIMSELGFKVNLPIEINEDNQGCVAFAKNPGSHDRTKHIDIKYHFVREKLEDGTFVVKYCNTEDMLADIFPKPFDGTQISEA